MRTKLGERLTRCSHLATGQGLTSLECASFFERTLPFMARLALELPSLLPEGLPLLAAGCEQEVSLSQERERTLPRAKNAKCKHWLDSTDSDSRCVRLGL